MARFIEQELVRLAQEGNQYAFDQLVEKYQSKVMQIVSRYADDQSEVMDITQETFIRAYLGLNNFRADSAFYTWLYRVAINTAKNYLLYKKRKTPTLDLDWESIEQNMGLSLLRDIESPESMLAEEELEQVLEEALKELPQELQETFLMRELDQYSYEEIAAALQIPVGTVRSRIFRARELINSYLDQYYQG